MYILYTAPSAAPQPGRLLQQPYLVSIGFTSPDELLNYSSSVDVLLKTNSGYNDVACITGYRHSIT